MKFFIEDFFSKCKEKCDQIRRKLEIWSYLLKKSLMENCIFCAVSVWIQIIVTMFVFLWFSNVHKISFSNFESNKFVEHQFCRVLFGVALSPFLLPATIIPHITQFYHLDPKFAVSLLNSLHIDDLNSGAHTIGEALEFFVKCKGGLALRDFKLCKFWSNSKELVN